MRFVHEKVRAIMKASGALREAIGEKVSSSDFQVIYPQCEAAFTPETMEDVNAKSCPRETKTDQDAVQSILCTTDVGLCRYESRGSVDGAASKATSV